MKLSKGLFIFAGIGLALGVTIDQIVHHDDLRVVHYTFPTLIAYLYALAYNGEHSIRLIFTSTITAFLLSFPLAPFLFGEEPEHFNHVICFVLIYPLFIFIGHCFHYAYHHDSTYKVSYKSLFTAVWNTFPHIFLAALFVGLGQLILGFGALVFKTAGSMFLWDLCFNNLHFRIITNIIFFFVGMNICYQNIGVVYNLRILIIRAMFYLFPFVALISISYFFFIFSNYITFKHQIVQNLNVLIPLVVLGITFFNAYLQDADDKNATPQTYNNFIKLYRVVFFALTIMLAHASSTEYDFDINVLVYLICVVFLGFVYFITIFFPIELEYKYIKLGNVSTAIFFMLALLILNFPYHPLIYTLNSAG